MPKYMIWRKSMKNEHLVCYSYKGLRFSKNTPYSGYSFESYGTLLHSHLDFYEIILITNGSYEHTINNLTTTLPTNTLLLFSPGITHQLFADPMQATHFVICVEQHYFEQFAARHFPDFQLHNSSHFFSKSVTKERAKYIESLGKTICSSSKLPTYLADEIAFLTLSDFSNYTPQSDIDVYIGEIITKLENLVYSNLSIEEICSYYHFSSHQILKRFKEMTGYTMVEYKKKQKLKYACKLLCNTDMKIIDIFTELHYNSLPYFLRAFKEAYGMSPTEYRKKNAKQRE